MIGMHAARRPSLAWPTGCLFLLAPAVSLREKSPFRYLVSAYMNSVVGAEYIVLFFHAERPPPGPPRLTKSI